MASLRMTGLLVTRPHMAKQAARGLHRHFSHGPIRLLAWQLHAVYWSVGLLLVTGLAWLGVHWFAPASIDGLPAPSPTKLWAMRLHAACALASLLAIGSLLPVHIRTAWHRRKNRWSGSVNLLVFSVLLLTGYALWYASEGAFKDWAVWLHWGLGLALPVVLVAHVVLGHLSRNLRLIEVKKQL